MSRRPLRRLATGALAALVALSGCTIRGEAEPRDIPLERRNDALRQNQVADVEATGDQRIYLFAPGDAQRLHTVSRDGTTPETLLGQLFDGPNSAERAGGLSTALPPDLALAAPVRLEAGVMTIDLDTDLSSAGTDLPAAVAQVVFTATQLPGVERVNIRVNDERRTWPDGSGTEQDVPLSVYDFPGFAESYAPAYPVVPPHPTPEPPPTVAVDAPAAASSAPTAVVPA